MTDAPDPRIEAAARAAMDGEFDLASIFSGEYVDNRDVWRDRVRVALAAADASDKERGIVRVPIHEAVRGILGDPCDDMLAAEREACAAICDDEADAAMLRGTFGHDLTGRRQAMEGAGAKMARGLARRIRARGEAS